jgi:transposase
VRSIGVDLAKRSFTASFLSTTDASQDESQLATFAMTPEGLAEFCARLQPDDRVAVEAGLNTYYFHDRVRAAVAEIVVVDPHQFGVIAKSKKKTDRHDATILAQYLKLGLLPAVVVQDPRIRELRQLFTAREAVVKSSTQLKNAGHALLCRNGLPSRKADFVSHAGRARLAALTGLGASDRLILDGVLRQLEAVEYERDELERAIIRVGKPLPGLKRLLQVRGLGLVAAIGVLAEIGDVTRFSNAKQLVSYAGLATAVYQSGAVDRRGHITKQGRKLLRGFMVEAVMSMLRDRPERNTLMDFYERKRREKGAGKAICATARKLLTVIYVLLTKELDYWFLEERLYQQKLKRLAKAA